MVLADLSGGLPGASLAAASQLTAEADTDAGAKAVGGGESHVPFRPSSGESQAFFSSVGCVLFGRSLKLVSNVMEMFPASGSSNSSYSSYSFVPLVPFENCEPGGNRTPGVRLPALFGFVVEPATPRLSLKLCVCRNAEYGPVDVGVVAEMSIFIGGSVLLISLISNASVS